MFGRTKKCIVCSKEIDKNDDHVQYEIRKILGAPIGKFYVHQQVSCLTDGLVILRKQVESSRYQNYIFVTVYIKQQKYTYAMSNIKNQITILAALTNQNGVYKYHKPTYEFLLNYKHYPNSVIFVYMKSLEDTPDASTPILISVDDPNVPTEFLDSENYKKHIANASKQFDISMEIRGKDKIEAMNILTEYAYSTVIII